MTHRPKLHTTLFSLLMVGFFYADGAQATWTKVGETLNFTFSWATENGQRTVKFSIPEEATTAAMSRIKPWDDKLPVQERLNLYNIHDGVAHLNYEKFIAEEQPALSGLTAALKQTAPKKTPRGLAEYALGFVQSIPYSTEFSNKADYQTPIGVLVENKGDCDSKGTLLAAILADFGVPWKLIVMENHLMVGMGIQALRGETTVKEDGQTYVIAETTGTGWRAGWSDKKELDEIKTGRFAVLDEKTAKIDGESDITQKIEAAKLAVATQNSALVGREATLASLRTLDPKTINVVKAALTTKRLASLGTYPNPWKPSKATSVVWNEAPETEEPRPTSLFPTGDTTLLH